MTGKTYATAVGSSAVAGLIAGFLAGRWYGAIVGAVLSVLVAELVLRQLVNRALEAFFDHPASALMPDLGIPSLPGAAALVGFAMTFDVPSIESVIDETDPVRASSRVGSGERIIALETLARVMTLRREDRPKESEPRALRRAEEFAMKFASRESAEVFLRRYLETALPSGDAEPLVKVALAILVLSPARNEEGAVERLETYLDQHGLPRESVRRAIDEGLCGRTSAWDLLGLPPSAAKEDVKKAYRTLSLALHPDAGGDLDEGSKREREEAFRRAKDAYDLLCAITP